MELSYEQLKKLQSNPFYKLSPKQQELLDRYESSQTNIFKHSTKFNKHAVRLEEEDGQSD